MAHNLQHLNNVLHVVKEELWAEVHYRKSKEWTTALPAECHAEVKKTEELCKELGSCTRALLRLLDSRSRPRGRAWQSESEESGRRAG